MVQRYAPITNNWLPQSSRAKSTMVSSANTMTDKETISSTNPSLPQKMQHKHQPQGNQQSTTDSYRAESVANSLVSDHQCKGYAPRMGGRPFQQQSMSDDHDSSVSYSDKYVTKKGRCVKRGGNDDDDRDETTTDYDGDTYSTRYDTQYGTTIYTDDDSTYLYAKRQRGRQDRSKYTVYETDTEYTINNTNRRDDTNTYSSGSDSGTRSGSRMGSRSGSGSASASASAYGSAEIDSFSHDTGTKGRSHSKSEPRDYKYSDDWDDISDDTSKRRIVQRVATEFSMAGYLKSKRTSKIPLNRHECQSKDWRMSYNTDPSLRSRVDPLWQVPALGRGRQQSKIAARDQVREAPPIVPSRTESGTGPPISPLEPDAIPKKQQQPSGSDENASDNHVNDCITEESSFEQDGTETTMSKVTGVKQTVSYKTVDTHGRKVITGSYTAPPKQTANGDQGTRNVTKGVMGRAGAGHHSRHRQSQNLSVAPGTTVKLNDKEVSGHSRLSDTTSPSLTARHQFDNMRKLVSTAPHQTDILPSPYRSNDMAGRMHPPRKAPCHQQIFPISTEDTPAISSVHTSDSKAGTEIPISGEGGELRSSVYTEKFHPIKCEDVGEEARNTPREQQPKKIMTQNEPLSDRVVTKDGSMGTEPTSICVPRRAIAVSKASLGSTTAQFSNDHFGIDRPQSIDLEIREEIPVDILMKNVEQSQTNRIPGPLKKSIDSRSYSTSSTKKTPNGKDLVFIDRAKDSEPPRDILLPTPVTLMTSNMGRNAVVTGPSFPAGSSASSMNASKNGAIAYSKQATTLCMGRNFPLKRRVIQTEVVSLTGEEYELKNQQLAEQKGGTGIGVFRRFFEKVKKRHKNGKLLAIDPVAKKATPRVAEQTTSGVGLVSRKELVSQGWIPQDYQLDQSVDLSLFGCVVGAQNAEAGAVRCISRLSSDAKWDLHSREPECLSEERSRSNRSSTSMLLSNFDNEAGPSECAQPFLATSESTSLSQNVGRSSSTGSVERASEFIAKSKPNSSRTAAVPKVFEEKTNDHKDGPNPTTSRSSDRNRSDPCKKKQTYLSKYRKSANISPHQACGGSEFRGDYTPANAAESSQRTIVSSNLESSATERSIEIGSAEPSHTRICVVPLRTLSPNDGTKLSSDAMSGDSSRNSFVDPIADMQQNGKKMTSVDGTASTQSNTMDTNCHGPDVADKTFEIRPLLSAYNTSRLQPTTEVSANDDPSLSLMKATPDRSSNEPEEYIETMLMSKTQMTPPSATDQSNTVDVPMLSFDSDENIPVPSVSVKELNAMLAQSSDRSRRSPENDIQLSERDVPFDSTPTLELAVSNNALRSSTPSCSTRAELESSGKKGDKEKENSSQAGNAFQYLDPNLILPPPKGKEQRLVDTTKALIDSDSQSQEMSVRTVTRSESTNSIVNRADRSESQVYTRKETSENKESQELDSAIELRFEPASTSDYKIATSILPSCGTLGYSLQGPEQKSIVFGEDRKNVRFSEFLESIREIPGMSGSITSTTDSRQSIDRANAVISHSREVTMRHVAKNEMRSARHDKKKLPTRLSWIHRRGNEKQQVRRPARKATTSLGGDPETIKTETRHLSEPSLIEQVKPNRAAPKQTNSSSPPVKTPNDPVGVSSNQDESTKTLPVEPMGANGWDSDRFNQLSMLGEIVDRDEGETGVELIARRTKEGKNAVLIAKAGTASPTKLQALRPNLTTRMEVSEIPHSLSSRYGGQKKKVSMSKAAPSKKLRGTNDQLYRPESGRGIQFSFFRRRQTGRQSAMVNKSGDNRGKIRPRVTGKKNKGGGGLTFRDQSGSPADTDPTTGESSASSCGTGIAQSPMKIGDPLDRDSIQKSASQVKLGVPLVQPASVGCAKAEESLVAQKSKPVTSSIETSKAGSSSIPHARAPNIAEEGEIDDDPSEAERTRNDASNLSKETEGDWFTWLLPGFFPPIPKEEHVSLSSSRGTTINGTRRLELDIDSDDGISGNGNANSGDEDSYKSSDDYLTAPNTLIGHEEWQEILDATETLAMKYKQSQMWRKQHDDSHGIVDDDSISKETLREVNRAIAKFRQHARLLGVKERDLMEAVRDDDRSIPSSKYYKNQRRKEAAERKTTNNLASQVGAATDKFIEMFDFYFSPNGTIGTDGVVDKDGGGLDSISTG